MEQSGAADHEQVSSICHELFNTRLMDNRGDYCEMKIKEKGLTGKAARNRRELMTRPRGFNAFQEMDKGKPTTREKKSNDSTKEVYLDFMGKNILIQHDNEGNGTVSAEDVPFVKGATLKFEGCVDVKWAQIKVSSFLDSSNLVVAETLT